MTIDGRRATIISAGKWYDTYIDFAVKYGYPDAAADWRNGGRKKMPDGWEPKNGDKVTILTSGPHGYGSTVYVVERADGMRFLIDERGLRIEPANLSDLPPSEQTQEIIANLAQRLTEAERRIAELTTQVRVAREDNALLEEGVTADIDRLERAVGVGKYAKAIGAGKRLEAEIAERTPKVGDRVVIVDECATNIGCARPNIENGKECVIKHIDGRDDFPYWIANVAEGKSGIYCARNSFVFADEYTRSTDVAKATAQPRNAIGKRQLSRDEIVERAKADVDKLIERARYGMDTPTTKEYGDLVSDFVVNREAHTVVALLRDRWTSDRTVRSRGKARCAPDDVFNVHIGKAIALRRALGLEVLTEYTNAPKPTEVRVGDVVAWNTQGNIRGSVTSIYDGKVRVNVTGTEWKFVPDALTVIDDSRDGGAE